MLDLNVLELRKNALVLRSHAVELFLGEVYFP